MERTTSLSDCTIVDLYVRELSGSEPLSPQEEGQLSFRIKKGDKAALDRLVRANLKFVISVARHYQHQGLPLADLINEGNMGLIRAAKSFDETKNFKFISYAVWWIRQSILQSLARQSRIVNVPLNRVGSIYKITQASKRLEQKFNRIPTIEEIALDLKCPEKDVIESLKLADGHISLDQPLKSDDDTGILDLLPDKDTPTPDLVFLEHSLHEEIERSLGSLDNREREIVRMYYGLGDESAHTLDEIGTRFHLTRERARQIKERALRRLRQTPRAMRLKTYA